MRPAQPVEREVGIERYVSDAAGMGGRLRASPTDFRVRELEAVDVEPLDADPGSYPHLVFRATLAGWDTNDFAARLADSLGISRERVRWAGTKDKRALTTQLFSVDVEPSALPSGFRAAELEPVGRLGRALRFGDLAGNAFEVTVRDADRPGAAGPITRELEAFAASGRPVDGRGTDEPAGGPAEAGTARSTPRIEGARVAVPNFFGQQRFGSRRPVTHRVGLAVVRNDWEGAVRAYLGEPRPTEPEDTRAARAMVDEGASWSAVLEAMPRKLGYERAMLHRLVERGDGDSAAFRAALEAVPSTLQRLFVHAAQSHLFNLILSRRLERGLPFDRAVVGDVVCFAARAGGGRADRDGDGGGAGGDTDTPELVLPDPDRNQRVTADRLETVNRHCARGRAFVTAPLVGTETTLGAGEPGRIEREVLETVGVEPADFEGPGAFGSSGTRRAILVPTVLDVDPGAGGPRDAAGDDGCADGDAEGEEAVAPTFSFALPRGAYATVLLREYLKVEPTSM